MRQDVWSKRTWQASDKELEQRKTLSEASKPTVNTPQQAKELERQALEKNPVTKLSPEQAQELEAKILGTNDKKDSVDTSSEVVASQLNDWERQNYSNKTEKGLLILPDGTTKVFGGIEHHVTGKEEDIKLMDGATFTHNHPTDNTFSQNDIVTGLVKGNLKEMRAVTSTGDIHILRNNDASVVDRRKFAADYSQMRMKAENIANKKILRGEHIDKDEYVKGRLEKLMEEHANEYNLSYTKSHINEISIDKTAKSGIIKSEGLFCYGDYLRDALGSALINNPKETEEIVNDIEKKGGKITFLSDNKKMVCNVEKGNPASIEVDENISIGGLKHEYRHFLDDMDNGNPGLGFYLKDKDKFFEYEVRGYEEELKIARELGLSKVEDKILTEIEKRRREIYGE